MLSTQKIVARIPVSPSLGSYRYLYSVMPPKVTQCNEQKTVIMVMNRDPAKRSQIFFGYPFRKSTLTDIGAVTETNNYP